MMLSHLINLRPMKANSHPLVLFILSLLAISQACFGQLPYTQWNEADCLAQHVDLVVYNFDQMPSGAYNDSYASQLYPGIALTSIAGTGILGVGPIEASQWGNFTGFAANGTPGNIYTSVNSSNSGPIRFCDLSFDVFAGELAGGLHGPTDIFVQIRRSGRILWQTESVTLLPGIANKLSWSLSNPDGNELNGDGINVLNPFPDDWRDLAGTLFNPRSLEFVIVASNANTTQTGLYLDNVRVIGSVVPEPSTCLLMMASVGYTFFSQRRRTCLTA